ncbi:YARHG domain-containing protein [Chenggangzhangella methanolivorans]|uniref:YARHG domain-containing protein n=1 Tax=Chenggangzhangella methanolivorans TaxID=1437009 RepID=UPI00360CDC18
MSAPAYADFPCDELEGERNAVYKDAGYCFKTTRAIRAFGNEGCQFKRLEDVPLSAGDRKKVAEIQEQERENKCPR